MVEETLTLHHRIRGAPAGIVARLFNVAGPRQVGSHGMVLPRFVEAAATGHDLIVYGDGTQTRCFTAVADVVEALVGLAVEPRARGAVFNVGATTPTRIGDLAKAVRDRAGSSSKIVHVDPTTIYGATFEDTAHRIPDVGAIARLIGWRPSRSIDQIIAELIELRTDPQAPQPPAIRS